MDCPNCRLVNLPEAVRCDCGYNFQTRAMDSPSRTPQSIQKKNANVWKIVGGAFLLLVGVANSSQQAKLPAGDLAGALGRLTGVLILVGLAAWLIASGLPRSIGLDKIQRRARRRIWYVYAGIGLLIMAVAAVLLAVAGLLVAAVLVTWLYWFGWTWIAWLIADKKASSRFKSKVVA